MRFTMHSTTGEQKRELDEVFRIIAEDLIEEGWSEDSDGNEIETEDRHIINPLEGVKLDVFKEKKELKKEDRKGGDIDYTKNMLGSIDWD